MWRMRAAVVNAVLWVSRGQRGEERMLLRAPSVSSLVSLCSAVSGSGGVVWCAYVWPAPLMAGGMQPV